MKKLILISVVGLFLSAIGTTAEPSYNPRRNFYPSTQKTLNLSASSLISYEEAMNKFARIKPDGYVIESVSYFKVKNRFVVNVLIRKI